MRLAEKAGYSHLYERFDLADAAVHEATDKSTGCIASGDPSSLALLFVLHEALRLSFFFYQ